MKVELLVKNGPAPKRKYRLRSSETIIGRQKGCDLRIPSADVSRRHCLLSYSAGRLTVEDLGSVNGTFVNSVPVAGKQNVRSGDRLTVGPLTFTVEFSRPPTVQDHPSSSPKTKKPEEAAPLPLADADEPPAFELIEEETPPTKPIGLQATSDDEPIRLKEDPDDVDGQEVILDENQPITLPEGEEFRKFLSNMER